MSATTSLNETAVTDLAHAADRLLTTARGNSGRAAHTLTPGAGAPLKQTLLALTAGTVLRDHASPGAATLQLLTGTVQLTAGNDHIELAAGSHVSIPPVRHGVTAVTDAVMLITVGGASGASPQPT